MENLQDIIDHLPYAEPFRFVDEVTYLDEHRVEGVYHFRRDEYFYAGHFPGYPVTPGVILGECMAQIGLVCLGLYLSLGQESKDSIQQNSLVLLCDQDLIFEKPVFPDTRVSVVGERKYWRLGKLRCKLAMYGPEGERLCHGVMSGIRHFVPGAPEMQSL